eukprot:g61646.t1
MSDDTVTETPAVEEAKPKKKFAAFGGGKKCVVCDKTVYPNEEVLFENKSYHTRCFACSICNAVIQKTSEAGSMDGRVSHRRCFETQMRESGGKYGGQKVVLGGKKVADAEKKEAESQGKALPPVERSTSPPPATEDGGASPVEQRSPREEDNTPALSVKDRMAALKVKSDEPAPERTTSSGEFDASGQKKKKKMNFGGGEKCVVCTKSVYSTEKVSFEGKTYHNTCFTCSICTKVIEKTSEAGSMDSKVSHRRCFETQMRESGGKYGGQKVVLGGKKAAQEAVANGQPAVQEEDGAQAAEGDAQAEEQVSAQEET